VVPAEVPALRLLCISDTHDLQQGMPHGLPAADILVHAGDSTCQGRREELESFTAWLHALIDGGTVRHAIVVAGNHEMSLALRAKKPAVLAAQQRLKDDFATSHAAIHYLEDKGTEVAGLRFYGSPWTSCTGESTWAFQLPESQLAERFSAIPAGVDVLVTHSPPLGLCDNGDVDADGRQRRWGSASLRQRAEEVRPVLHVFGHIHTGHGVVRTKGCRTVFVNAAVCDEDYKPNQKPVLVELLHSAPVTVDATTSKADSPS